MEEQPKRQDTWLATVDYRDALGKSTNKQRGVAVLPYPMEASDAVDYLTRRLASDALRFVPDAIPYEIHCVVWGMREKGREPGPYQAYGFLANYDRDTDTYMRPAIQGVQEREEVQPPESTKFFRCNWR